MESQPEAWLRGPIDGVSPLIGPLLFSFQQAREDLRHSLDGLTAEQIWATPHGFGSLGFHLRHIAGSTDRLTTYLQGAALTPEQLAVLHAEHAPQGAGSQELLALVDDAFRKAETIVRTIDPSTFAEPRTVGRKHLPTTVIGLLVHIAEHTQRHVGQAISAAKLARAGAH
jgi:DinB superfamily